MSEPAIEDNMKALSIDNPPAPCDAPTKNQSPNPEKKCYTAEQLRQLTIDNVNATNTLPIGLQGMDLNPVPKPTNEKTRGSPRGSPRMSPRMSPRLSPHNRPLSPSFSPSSGPLNWKGSPALVPLGSVNGHLRNAGDGFSLGGSQNNEIEAERQQFRATWQQPGGDRTGPSTRANNPTPSHNSRRQSAPTHEAWESDHAGNNNNSQNNVNNGGRGGGVGGRGRGRGRGAGYRRASTIDRPQQHHQMQQASQWDGARRGSPTAPRQQKSEVSWRNHGPRATPGEPSATTATGNAWQQPHDSQHRQGGAARGGRGGRGGGGGRDSVASDGVGLRGRHDSSDSATTATKAPANAWQQPLATGGDVTERVGSPQLANPELEEERQRYRNTWSRVAAANGENGNVVVPAPAAAVAVATASPIAQSSGTNAGGGKAEEKSTGYFGVTADVSLVEQERQRFRSQWEKKPEKEPENNGPLGDSTDAGQSGSEMHPPQQQQQQQQRQQEARRPSAAETPAMLNALFAKAAGGGGGDGIEGQQQQQSYQPLHPHMQMPGGQYGYQPQQGYAQPMHQQHHPGNGMPGGNYGPAGGYGYTGAPGAPMGQWGTPPAPYGGGGFNMQHQHQHPEHPRYYNQPPHHPLHQAPPQQQYGHQQQSAFTGAGAGVSIGSPSLNQQGGQHGVQQQHQQFAGQQPRQQERPHHGVNGSSVSNAQSPSPMSYSQVLNNNGQE